LETTQWEDDKQLDGFSQFNNDVTSVKDA